MPPPLSTPTPPPQRPPLLLRSAGWRLALVLGLGALLIALWGWGRA